MRNIETLARHINNMKKPKPFLKWAGGKKQLLLYLIKHVPITYGKFIEPMVGGGALFFYLLPKQAVLADLNEELINCFKVVRDNVQGLINELKKFINEESFYYSVREQNPIELTPEQRAARIIYLNKTCYNGLYRVNKDGKFNVPFGRRVNPTILDEPNLLAANIALQGVKLVKGDYKRVLKKYAQPGD